MATYNSIVITDAGIELLRNTVLKNRMLNPGEVVTSPFVLTNPKTAVLIPGVVQNQPYSLYSKEKNQIVLEAQLTNQGVLGEYALNTLGFYTNDGVGPNILTAIITAKTADLIPPEASYPVNLNFKAVLVLDNGGNVNVQATFAGYASEEDLEEHIEAPVDGVTGAHGLRYKGNDLQAERSGHWLDVGGDTVAQIANHVYNGVDLAQKHAAEIAGYSSVWAWIKNRILGGNFNGINVHDYIPLQVGSASMLMEVAGINTYSGLGSSLSIPGFTPVRSHIDFISRNLYPNMFAWSEVSCNNGMLPATGSISLPPWRASDLYARLNSLATEVLGGTTSPRQVVKTAVNYTQTGIYHLLPSELKAVIVEKMAKAPQRYNSSYTATGNSGWTWCSLGKLWLPSEVEVFGCTTLGDPVQYEQGCFVQYPIFAHHVRKRVKTVDVNHNAYPWWTITAANNSYLAMVSVSDYAVAQVCSPNAFASFPICFRIGL